MAKRQIGWTESKIARYTKKGRGQGELALYKPWLTIQDVPSDGRVHRSVGWKTEREHYFLSDLEFNYFCLCDWADDVLDIREQFPLDREATLAIAEELGIRHSKDKKTSTPIVMTTDFFLTVREDGHVTYKARTIKMAKDLNDKRNIEKFEIERVYWGRQGIDWAIVTEAEMPITFVNNLKFIKESYKVDDMEKVESLLFEWNNFEGNLLKNLKAFDKKYNFELGTGISIYKHALAKKIFTVDMTKKIDLNEDIQNIKILKQRDASARWA
ncbi:TnsA endonuclease N-terminal domain-containing protein [Bacillus tropicus]|uniref:TnsA endonuclease N-terminal domain-containing protein n=1 Tax=Bacillus tropicus TaxID=2026188 RepID=UPI003D9A420E